MSRRFTIVTVALAAVVAFLVGAIVAGGLNQPQVTAGAPAKRVAASHPARPAVSSVSSLVNFADVVERINPAVVNIDATASGSNDGRRRRPSFPSPPDLFERPDGLRGDGARRGAGSGFIIDADGSIL